MNEHLPYFKISKSLSRLTSILRKSGCLQVMFVVFLLQLPDRCLLRHDRDTVIVRAQGHLIRPVAPLPAAITYVLDDIRPNKLNLLQ